MGGVLFFPKYKGQKLLLSWGSNKRSWIRKNSGVHFSFSDVKLTSVYEGEFWEKLRHDKSAGRQQVLWKYQLAGLQTFGNYVYSPLTWCKQKFWSDLDPIGTSHGGLRDFSSELTKNIPTNPHPHPDWNFYWGLSDFSSEITKNARPTQIGSFHGGLRKISSKLTKNTQSTPTTMQIGTSYGGLGDFSSELTKNTPTHIGTSQGGLGDFSSELTKNTPTPTQIGTSYGGLGDFGSDLTKNTTPTPTQIGTSYGGLRISVSLWVLSCW